MFIERLKHTLRRGKLGREDIKAVHDDDLIGFLRSLGLLHDIRSGKIRCKFCHDPIDIEKIQAVFPDSGSISLVCNKEQCIKQFLDYPGVNK